MISSPAMTPSCSEDLSVSGALVIAANVFRDARGSFEVAWETELLLSLGIEFQPSNAHHSYNVAAGTLRGLHYQQAPHGQAKLISCVSGSIWDVMVDLRSDSPSFGKWCGTQLDAESGKAVYIPAGCAHGFVTLADQSTVAYLIEGEYCPEAGGVLRWNDPHVAVKWPVDEPQMSEKDRSAPGWNECGF